MTFVTSCILGAGHVASWNVQFLRVNGQLWWRLCTVYLLIAPLTWLPFTPLHPAGYKVFRLCWDRLKQPNLRASGGRSKLSELLAVGPAILTTLILLYAAARLILLGLVVYSFYSLPAKVYATSDPLQWFHFLPLFH